MEDAANAEARRRAEVITAARKYIGVKWQHLGRGMHGLDCVGLVVVVCRQLGISGYDVATYPREAAGSQFLAHFIRGGGVRVSVDAALPADLLLFRERRYPCHVAILSQCGAAATIIHAHATRRAVLEEVLAKEWPARRVAAIRLPGMRA